MMEQFSPPSALRRRHLLWVLTLPAGPNGSTLRYLNYSKCLREAGFSVHFAVPDSSFDQNLLEDLVKGGWSDEFSKISVYHASGVRNAFSKLLVLPALRDRVMAGRQAAVREELLTLVDRYDCGICIISDPGYLFCVSSLSHITRVIIDWCDSATLFYWRALAQSIRSRNWREIPGRLHQGLVSFLNERYYPRLPHANLVVSPADQAAFLRVCPDATDLRMVLNGIESPERRQAPAKVEGRLVFSGRMDYAPNYESALWFMDHVLPEIRKRKPAAHLVIAGANPVPQLLARQSKFVRITGEVPDMRAELAQASLYVAPLVSGGGFKNKVFESIAAGTAVVGTPLAAEFLPPDLNSVVFVASNPGEFANTVVDCLEKPDMLTDKISRAQEFLRLHFSWPVRTADLISVLDPEAAVMPQRQ
jgi:glycosyltransferase involved in cell wall biosynthesis